MSWSIVPNMFCALLGWLVAHPEQVRAMAEEVGGGMRAAAPSAEVREVVVYRQPLEDGEVLEYVWRDDVERSVEDRAALRRDAVSRKAYNGLRVVKGGVVIASHAPIYEANVYPPDNVYKDYIVLPLAYGEDAEPEFFVLKMRVVVDALRDPKKYKARIIHTTGSAAVQDFDGWYEGRVYAARGCCGMTDHWSVDPVTMKHRGPVSLNVLETRTEKAGERKETKFRFSTTRDGSINADIIVYSLDLFYLMLNGKWMDALDDESRAKRYSYKEHHDKPGDKYNVVYLNLKDGDVKDGQLSAMVVAECYEKTECDYSDDCPAGEVVRTIRERRSWPADRPHLISHVDYLKRCDNGR